MSLSLIGRYASVALSVLGSAILLISCEGEGTDAEPSENAILSEYSENLSVIKSENGRRSLLFETPRLEGYTLGKEPYREFRDGVRVTTYEDDSLSTVKVVLVADYAIFYENRNLWEARGDVVVRKADGKTLYTQQLFWNLTTKKVYSNVDSKVVENGGRDVAYGEGFESDETLSDIHWRRLRSMMTVNVANMTARESDSTHRVSTRRDQPVEESRPPVGKVGTKPGTAKTPAPTKRPSNPDNLHPEQSGPMQLRMHDAGGRRGADIRKPRPISGRADSASAEKTYVLKPQKKIE
ncbi:MAG: LPS export ABC transporter periplasmic protein LptC [Alistipes sp.]|nr:LPS export ABC transporter periplasmic protein LptC [Alistipes sp.]MDE6779286.1 LPS export ABC transporter periplasmic protein LptC [Alistipes sp.]MDE6857926.1 LPS export ABC transporter periplasmic protein LptC [Alistipes sp.]